MACFNQQFQTHSSFVNCEVLALNQQQLDITDCDAVERVIKQLQPDYVINTAAYTAVDEAEEHIDLAYAVNHQGAQNLAIACNNIGATLFHLSTDYVFSGNKLTEYVEDDIPAPVNVYGASKLAGENAVKQHNPKHIIVRTAWLFSEYGDNFVRTMLKLAGRENLDVVDDQMGKPTYAGDLGVAIFQMIIQLNSNTNAQQQSLIKQNNDLYGVYHFSGLHQVSWYQFAQCIFAKLAEVGSTSPSQLNLPKVQPIDSRHYQTKAVRPKNSRLNCDKIAKHFGILPNDWSLALTRVVTAIWTQK
ncbi:dTDP-4-dehydrorhamnose reductase [Shewanella gaetbuli]|uniref:dTDP-4-dehydrorhamnose reductase n=2 Tax=Shewanella gaetbuli TaxID=220752 RepID=A0A9X2CKF8_9GAMM|nr:dTDP-4-dehydrorhamnose reductase [Shewanella gaetbuli]